MSDVPIPEAPCDLVMKGGITSGVVYPRMIEALASRFQFKNLGGTSAGAIAAAAAAAAEHRRLTRGDASGFEKLGMLPDELGAPAGSTGVGSMLFHLFQPAPAVASHFAVLMSMLNSSPLAAVGRASIAMVRQFWATAGLGLLLALLLFTPVVVMAWPGASLPAAATGAFAITAAWWSWAFLGSRRLEKLKASPWLWIGGWWLAGVAVTALALFLVTDSPDRLRLWAAAVAAGIAAPLTIGLVALLAGLRFATTLVAGLHTNGWGLCSGRTVVAKSGRKDEPKNDAKTPAGLTDWLATYLDELAGIENADHPLCFGDLWGAPRDGALFGDVAPQDRKVNLEMMTTAVSQHLCYAIPFRDDVSLYFDSAEMHGMFPNRIADWLATVSRAEKSAGRLGSERTVWIDGAADRKLSLLPANANLPVVFAVRMSLSFPLLLSALPLYAVDRSRVKNKGSGDLYAKRVWFSDGGIASNMPLHFFDAMLPRHPTFAVDLKQEHPDHLIKEPPGKANEDGRVFLPDEENGTPGALRYWKAPRDDQAFGGLIDFVVSIVSTMQNWRDESLFPYPGYRDRIVQISQRNGEGGLNLNMPKEDIDHLSEAGRFAADRLGDRFFPIEGAVSDGWKQHQDVRLRSFLGAVETMVAPLYTQPPDPTWNSVLAAVSARNYDPCRRGNAQRCLDELRSVGGLLHPATASLADSAPRPRGSLRMTPRI